MGKMNPFHAFLLGGVAFLGISYVLHCGFGLGPWGCQRNDARRLGNGAA